MKKGIIIGICLLSASLVFAGVGVRPASEISNDTTDWMKKVADWQLTQSSWNSSVSWERGALFAGMMACYEATKDETYLDKSREFAEKFNWSLASTSHHADNNAVGQDYMEMYFLDAAQDPTRYAHFKTVSDAHVAADPTFACDVASGNETWWWCDALFMAPPGLARLARATEDGSYLTFMHRMWGETQDCLYDTDDHLFYRDITYKYPDYSYNGVKVFWSRGNGWVVAGTVRVLQYLPEDDSYRGRYTTLLQEMSSALLNVQQEDGYWYSDLLSPERTGSPETSGTGFFTYGIAWGINNGLLDAETYWPAVEAGWEALKVAVQSNGLLGWVQPVGSGPSTSTTATSTDVFGVGAYLLAGSEVLKYLWSIDSNTIECFESYTSDAALQAAWVDGDSNGTNGQVTLGDYGDNFMQLSYANDAAPYQSQADRTFAAAKDFTLNTNGYLSVLVRGNSSNAADQMYVTLKDTQGNSSTQIMMDTTVVQTESWMELGFRMDEFAGIDLTQIATISIGVGVPNSSSATGVGIVRIDNIRLYSEECRKVQADFNNDCMVDMADFTELAEQWLEDYSVTTVPADPGTASLVAYWPLDGDYSDASGNGYDASLTGTATFESGHINQGISFSSGGWGTTGSGYLVCNNSTGITLDNGGTVSAWVKTGYLSAQYASVVTKAVSSWRLIRNSYSNYISFHFNTASGTEIQANGDITVVDDEWHYLMGIYDSSAGTVSLYVDGQLDAVAYTSGATMNVNTAPVCIGGRSDNTSGRRWMGMIDEVRIYNTAMTDANRLYLAELGSIKTIPDQRATDLVYDGVIDIEDVLIFIESWSQDTYWP